MSDRLQVVVYLRSRKIQHSQLHYYYERRQLEYYTTSSRVAILIPKPINPPNLKWHLNVKIIYLSSIWKLWKPSCLDSTVIVFESLQSYPKVNRACPCILQVICRKLFVGNAASIVQHYFNWYFQSMFWNSIDTISLSRTKLLSW